VKAESINSEFCIDADYFQVLDKDHIVY
jgi:hypothetical protein